MRLDPFRIQILTLSLDSQIVLTLVGLVVAGLVVRQAARLEELTLSAGHWWDLVLAAVVGARLVWVITHAGYFLRQPLQAVVVLDGGLHPVGLALGAAYWVWRFCRPGAAPPWAAVVDVLAVGVLTTSLFERVGCALTTCGTGPSSELPWAILRGDAWYEPMALEQVIILAIALMIAAVTLRTRGAACFTMLAALALAEVVAVSAGDLSAERAIALAALVAIYASSWWCSMAAARKDVKDKQDSPCRSGDGSPEASLPHGQAADHRRM